MLQLGVGAEAALVGPGRPDIGAHIVGELGAAREPHGEDGVQPGVVDRGAPVGEGPPGHQVPKGGELLLVLRVLGGDAGLLLPFQGPVGPKGRGHVEHRGVEALPHLGVHQLVEQEGVEHEAGPHGAHRGLLGVDQHRTGGPQVVGDSSEQGVVAQKGRVRCRPGRQRLQRRHQLHRRVVVGGAYQKRSGLVDALPGLVVVVVLTTVVVGAAVVSSACPVQEARRAQASRAGSRRRGRDMGSPWFG